MATPFYYGRNYDYGPTMRIADLIRASGQNQAESERRSGEIAANRAMQLGQLVSGGVQSYMQERAEAPRRAQEAELRDIQIQGARTEQAAAERLGRQDSAFMALLEQQPDPDPKELMAIFGPQRGMQIAQGFVAFKDLSNKAVTDARETAGRLALGAKALSPQMRASMWPSIREAAIKGGLGDAETVPEQPTPEYFDAVIGWATGQAPAAPPALIQRDPTKDLVNPQTGDVVTPGTPQADKVTFGQPTPAMVNGRRVFVRAGSDGKAYDMAGAALKGEPLPVPDAGPADNEPLVSIVGPDGKPVLVRRRDAVGRTPATGSQKPATGLEKRALNFFNRARQADLDLEGMEEQVRDLNLGGQAWMAIMPNFMQTELGQQYTQAQRAFTEARLRKDSGAAIPEQEFANDRKTYFAQPGDSPETLEQKRRGRAAVLASLGFESGQALGEFVGDAEEASRIVNDYRGRSEKKTNGKQKVGRFEVEEEP